MRIPGKLLRSMLLSLWLSLFFRVNPCSLFKNFLHFLTFVFGLHAFCGWYEAASLEFIKKRACFFPFPKWSLSGVSFLPRLWRMRSCGSGGKRSTRCWLYPLCLFFGEQSLRSEWYSGIRRALPTGHHSGQVFAFLIYNLLWCSLNDVVNSSNFSFFLHCIERSIISLFPLFPL